MGRMNGSDAWATPQGITNAVLFSASHEARNITGVALPVDTGSCPEVRKAS